MQETQLNDHRDAPGLRRAVIHAAEELAMLARCAQEEAPEAKMFYAGVSAAADTLDITFKRYFAGLHPSTYAAALEQGVQQFLQDKLDAADIIRNLLAGDTTAAFTALDWLAKNAP